MYLKPGESLYSRRKPSPLNLIFNCVLAIILVLLLCEINFTLHYTSIYVEGQSMMPTLTGAPEAYGGNIVRGGDYVFVDVRAKPSYSDIVVVKAYNEIAGEHNIIKRAVAFGGDTVKMEEGVLYLKKYGENDFFAVEEGYLAQEYVTASKSINNFGEHTVAENCMFLLGDNRDNSSDSRGPYGDFEMSALVGVVPRWSLQSKKFITSVYSFFDFDLGLGRMKKTNGESL